MKKHEAIELFRSRKTVVDNSEKIMNTVKSSQKADLSSTGQMSLFDAGMKDVIGRPKLVEHSDPIDIMQCVREEIDLLGMCLTYDPLEEYEIIDALYCTHTTADLLSVTENTKGMIVMDWIYDIDYRISKKSGTPYCKLHLASLGADHYLYLWGKNFQKLIKTVFKNNVYLLEVEYMEPTPEFSKSSLVCSYLKNVKSVDPTAKYKQIIAEMDHSELDEPWMLKNRKL